MLWYNDVLTGFFELATLSLNILLCYDLVITLGSPFEVAGKRISYYQLSSVAFSLVLTVYLWFAENQRQYDEALLSKTDFELSHLILSFVMTSYIMMALYSVIFSNRRLTRPGVSAELRKVFVKKHSHYVYLFTAIWILQLAQAFEHLFGAINDAEDIINPPPFQSVFKQMTGVMDLPAGVALFSTGLLLSAIRFNEPIFRFLCKKFILRCFGIIAEEEKDGL